MTIQDFNKKPDVVSGKKNRVPVTAIDPTQGAGVTTRNSPIRAHHALKDEACQSVHSLAAQSNDTLSIENVGQKQRDNLHQT